MEDGQQGGEAEWVLKPAMGEFLMPVDRSDRIFFQHSGNRTGPRHEFPGEETGAKGDRQVRLCGKPTKQATLDLIMSICL